MAFRVLVLPLALVATVVSASPALADIPPRSPGGGCNCSTPGLPADGALPASLVGVGVGMLVLATRRSK